MKHTWTISRILALALTVAVGACGGTPTGVEPETDGGIDTATTTSESPIAAAGRRLGDGAFVDAVEILEPHLRATPQDLQAWLMLSRAHRGAGAFEEALAATESAARLPGAGPGAVRERFLTEIAMGELDAALASYRTLRGTPTVDLSGLHLAPEMATVAADQRFAELFPAAFDDPFVEGEAVLHDWRGPGAGHEFGWEARNVGDVDGDGINDAVVSAPANQPGGGGAGSIWVYSGRGGGLLWSLEGEEGEQLGVGVEAAGDVDGDGVPDVVASGPGLERVHVLAGRSGDHLWLFEGFPGQHVASAGDVDRDGHADVLVGAPSAAAGAGAARVYSGRDGEVLLEIEGEEGEALGSAVGGRSEGEGFLLVIGSPGAEGGGLVRVYADLSGEPAFVISPQESSRQLGGMFVSVVGDVDGDGRFDVYASDWQDASKGPVTGRIYVHSGRNGERLLTLAGENAGDGFGIGPARAGDVDGDGCDDLVVGAWQHGAAAHSGGKVYVFSGRDGSLLRAYTGKVPGETLGFDADGMGDVNGDGAADFLVTSAWSLIDGPRSGRAMIVSGG